jgi:hypothetical protein
MNLYSIDKLMSEARRLAADYRRATGKTLPITGEIAIHDAIRYLNLEPAEEGIVGYDALRREGNGVKRFQVKGRAIFDETKSGHRLGQLKVEQPWDAVLLVLMDEAYETSEIYEANRTEILEVLNDAGESRRANRGAMSVARFKIVGRLVWSQERGLEDDGYWDNVKGPW